MPDLLPLCATAGPPTRHPFPPQAVDDRRLARLLWCGVRTWNAAGELPETFKFDSRTLW